MARDPLVIVRKLRDQEVKAARRVVAEREAELAAAAARVAAADQAMRDEAAVGDPGSYAAWLRRALAGRAAAEAARHQAEAAVEEARDALADARRAERAIERLQEERAAQARREAERRLGQQIDDWAALRLAAARR